MTRPFSELTSNFTPERRERIEETKEELRGKLRAQEAEKRELEAELVVLKAQLRELERGNR